MASDDFSGVTVSFDKVSYAKGELMTLTVTGQNKHTTEGATTHETVVVNATVQSNSGTLSVLQGQTVDVTTVTVGGVTMEDVVIRSASDGSNRTYTAQSGSGGHVFTAVA